MFALCYFADFALIFIQYLYICVSWKALIYTVSFVLCVYKRQIKKYLRVIEAAQANMDMSRL